MTVRGEMGRGDSPVEGTGIAGSDSTIHGGWVRVWAVVSWRQTGHLVQPELQRLSPVAGEVGVRIPCSDVVRRRLPFEDVPERRPVEQALRWGGALCHHKLGGAFGSRLGAAGSMCRPMRGRQGWPRVQRRISSSRSVRGPSGRRRPLAVARSDQSRPVACGQSLAYWTSHRGGSEGMAGGRGGAASCGPAERTGCCALVSQGDPTPRVPGMRRGSTCLRTGARRPYL